MAISYRLKHVKTGDIQITQSVQRKVFLEANGYRIDVPQSPQLDIPAPTPKTPKS